MLRCLFNQEVFVEACHMLVEHRSKDAKKCPICYPEYQRSILTFNTLKLVVRSLLYQVMCIVHFNNNYYCM